MLAVALLLGAAGRTAILGFDKDFQDTSNTPPGPQPGQDAADVDATTTGSDASMPGEDATGGGPDTSVPPDAGDPGDAQADARRRRDGGPDAGLQSSRRLLGRRGSYALDFGHCGSSDRGQRRLGFRRRAMRCGRRRSACCIVHIHY